MGVDWATLGRQADDAWGIYQAVERLRAAVERQLGAAEAARGAAVGSGAGGIPYAGAIVRVIDFATAAVEHPHVTALGAGAALTLALYGLVRFGQEVVK